MLSACAKTNLLTDVLSVLIATEIGVSVYVCMFLISQKLPVPVHVQTLSSFQYLLLMAVAQTVQYIISGFVDNFNIIFA